MSVERQHVQFGETVIEYSLTYAPRQTLAISVHPDLRVTVTAPQDTPLAAVADRVKHRASWILRQQRDFELFLPLEPPRQYVSGETHRYLGRRYRLKVLQAVDVEQVKLIRGFLQVWVHDRADSDRIRQLLDGWYRRQAERMLPQRIALMRRRFSHLDLPASTLAIRRMQTRWGSCTKAGLITLNLRLMEVAKPYVDYVIVHELCHLVEHNHSGRFYRLLDRAMPDWRVRRERLNGEAG